jgi:hypothetical protein
MPEYTLIPVCDTSEWMKALSSCSEFDVYHGPKYHYAAKQQDEGEPYLFFYKRENHSAALPILLCQLKQINGLESSEYCDVTSVYGYPGITTTMQQDTLGAEVFRAGFQDAFMQCLTDHSVVAFFSRTNPLLDNSWLLEGLAEIITLSSTVAIDLRKPEKEQLAGMSKGHRCDIRKAYREGVSAEEDIAFEYLDNFIDVYNESMLRVSALDYYFFPREYYLNLKKILGDSLKLFVARFESRILSASMFLLSDRIIQYHLSGTYSDCFPYNGAKIILDTMRTWGSERNYSWLHLGGGVGSAEDQLFRFKAGFSRLRLPFKIIRMVVNEREYLQLCHSREEWLNLHGYETALTDYFPKYRTPFSNQK